MTAYFDTGKPSPSDQNYYYNVLNSNQVDNSAYSERGNHMSGPENSKRLYRNSQTYRLINVKLLNYVYSVFVTSNHLTFRVYITLFAIAIFIFISIDVILYFNYLFL